MRKIIISESQFKHIVGESDDLGGYLTDTGDYAKEPATSYGEEVSVSDKNDDGDETDVVTADKIAKERAPKYPIWRAQTGMMESNQDLANSGKSVSFGKNTNMGLASVSNANPNDKMVKNMVNNHQMTTNAAYTRNNRLNQMRKNDPERYARIGGKVLQRQIQSQLNAKKAVSRNRKQAQKNMGNGNAFQKEGGMRNSGNGMAHTPKIDPFA